MKKTRIFIVDDHSVVREGFVSLLLENEKYHVSGQACNGAEALEEIEAMEFKPHVVLMDLNMPAMDGITCTTELAAKYPDMKVIVLSMIKDAGHVKRMLEAGAVGYILKSSDKHTLYEAIDSVLNGNTFFCEEVSRIVLEGMTRMRNYSKSESNLSARELEVLKLILDDFPNKAIAEKLGISVRTVETHKQNLIAKTGTNSVAGLVVYALKKNLVDE